MNPIRDYIFFVYCAACVLTSRVNGENEATSYSFASPKSNSSDNRTIDKSLKAVTDIDLYGNKGTSKIDRIPNKDIGNSDTSATFRKGAVDIPTEGGSIRQPLRSLAKSWVPASSENNRRITTTMSDDAPRNESGTNILAKEGANRVLSTSLHGSNLSVPFAGIRLSTLRPKTIDADNFVDVYQTKTETETSNKTLEVNQRKPKPKPLVTVGGAGVDEPIPASPALSRGSSVPRKMDYVVPAVITVLALPLLAAAAFVLYTRGREFWDKRHYRRMDFLIDGMYNE